jgi:Rubisco Assembly chaperone C-terminal domain
VSNVLSDGIFGVKCFYHSLIVILSST